MHPLVRLTYEAAGAMGRAAIVIAPPGRSKFLRAFKARRGLCERYEAWGRAERDPARPLVWIHAPSVGEGLQAFPIIERLRSRHPDTQIAFTFFSPSAERFASTVGADYCDYLPFDTPREMERVLAALDPLAIIFSKLDVWPTLVEKAHARGTKLCLMSATVPARSRRRSEVALLALREAYEQLDIVGAISPSDAERLLMMGVRGDRMTVTGDTRYDQVWARATTPNVERDAIIERYGDTRPTLVAGSTWPADEQRLLPAWLHVKREMTACRLVIAPHELSRRHLSNIESWARESKLSLSHTSDPDAGGTDVLLVDQYGILADLYGVGDAAYVGGGFHAAGLHSLLEPAAFGMPVLFGPMHADNRDANLLIADGAAMRCAGPGDISARILAWFKNPPVLSRASASAKRVVEAGIGAADKSAELLDALFESRTDQAEKKRENESTGGK